MAVSADLDLALRLADAADAISLGRFRARDLVVETKPDRTPVTEADRAVERELRAMLALERRPDAMLGEEAGETGSGRRRWMIDPIDGTRNYSRGVPVWATLIALEVDGARRARAWSRHLRSTAAGGPSVAAAPTPAATASTCPPSAAPRTPC